MYAFGLFFALINAELRLQREKKINFLIRAIVVVAWAKNLNKK